ncbi:MAG TPA: aspartate/glutamate racemase family protein [Pseudomonadales bacterium]|nr:aspartate/glutamate racemase family protein [Pseudomonadales bacterium]
MKTLGLLGGMSWESTVPYYQHVNRRVAARLGGLHSARLVLYSVDFAAIEAAQHEDRWADATAMLIDGGRRLEAAGAELLVLCTNTMHLVAPELEAGIGIPMLHIVEPTAAAIRARGLSRVALLGTRFTMEQDFYRGRLASRHGLQVTVPDPDGRAEIHRIIYEELCRGRVEARSRDWARALLAELVAEGAEAVILGCTELALLLGPDDASVPLFDTAELHAIAAADAALDGLPDAIAPAAGLD